MIFEKNSQKIFELAKELEMGPLDLVEELKLNGIAVRNHMSEISQEEIQKFLKISGRLKEKEKSSLSKKVLIRKYDPLKDDYRKYLSTNSTNLKGKLPINVLQKIKNEIVEFELKNLPFDEILKKYKIENLRLYKDFSCRIRDFVELYELRLSQMKNEYEKVFETTIHWSEISNIRKLQYEKMGGDEKDHGKDFFKQGICGEIAFEELCQNHKNKFKCVDLNEFEHDGPNDFSLSGNDLTRDVDVKTKSKNGIIALEKDRQKKGEIVGLFISDKRQYEKTFLENRGNDSELAVCFKMSFVGFYDERLIPKTLFDDIKSWYFLNPLLFVDYKYYLKINEPRNYSPVDFEVSSYFLANHEIHGLWWLLKYYGAEQVLQLDIDKYIPENLHSLVEKLKNHRSKLHLTPIIIFEWIVESWKNHLFVSFGDIQKYILPFCVVNEFHVNQLKLLTQVQEFVLNEENKCVHTGVPLKQCAITYKNGCFYASSRFGFSNTLLGHSWQGGRVISIAIDKRCACGCLKHQGNNRKWIGKRDCPFEESF